MECSDENIRGDLERGREVVPRAVGQVHARRDARGRTPCAIHLLFEGIQSGQVVLDFDPIVAPPVALEGGQVAADRVDDARSFGAKPLDLLVGGAWIDVAKDSVQQRIGVGLGVHERPWPRVTHSCLVERLVVRHHGCLQRRKNGVVDPRRDVLVDRDPRTEEASRCRLGDRPVPQRRDGSVERSSAFSRDEVGRFVVHAVEDHDVVLVWLQRIENTAEFPVVRRTCGNPIGHPHAVGRQHEKHPPWMRASSGLGVGQQPRERCSDRSCGRSAQ